MFKQVKPLKYKDLNEKEILTFLTESAAKAKSQQLSYSEFFDIVRETFVSNPDFFMSELYQTFRNDMGKFLGVEKRNDMERSIIENCCLYEGEQILFECDGNIRQKVGGFSSLDRIFQGAVYSRVRGRLYVTNNRIIAQGKLGTVNATEIGLMNKVLDGGKSTKFVRDSSLHQELPCYGYNFQINCQLRIVKKRKSILPFIGLWVITDNREDTTKPPKKLELIEAFSYLLIMLKDNMKLNTLYEILRNDADDVLAIIKEQLKKVYPPKHVIGYVLRSLRESIEVQRFTDSEYFHVVKETCKLNPEFFMTSIYPAMKTWSSSSFNSVKKELFDILRKENLLTKDLDRTKDTIKKLLESKIKDKRKRTELIRFLLDLREDKGLQWLTDSEFLDIVEITYKMNPQFFMNHVYPKLKSMIIPSIASIKEDFITLIEKLNK